MMINREFVGGIICGTIGICLSQIAGIPFGTLNWWLMYLCYTVVVFYVKMLVEEFFYGKS